MTFEDDFVEFKWFGEFPVIAQSEGDYLNQGNRSIIGNVSTRE